jgi:hypothetical protein
MGAHTYVRMTWWYTDWTGAAWAFSMVEKGDPESGCCTKEAHNVSQSAVRCARREEDEAAS